MTITFRSMSPSPAIEADVHEKAARLETFFDRITSVRVVIEAPHHGHRHGKLFHVRIDLRLPGREIVVSRDPAAHHTHEDVYVAIRDAFDEAKRQLQDHAKAIRVGMKTHEPTARAQITRLHPDEGYGFIETSDGREISLLEAIFCCVLESRVLTELRSARTLRVIIPWVMRLLIRDRPCRCG